MDTIIQPVKLPSNRGTYRRHTVEFKRTQFGRKSEKLDHQIEQLELQLEDLQADEGEAARELPATEPAVRKKPVRLESCVQEIPMLEIATQFFPAPTEDFVWTGGGEKLSLAEVAQDRDNFTNMEATAIL